MVKSSVICVDQAQTSSNHGAENRSSASTTVYDNPLLPLRGGLARAHARPIGIGPTARSASEYQPETRLGIAIYGGARRRHRKRPVYGPYPHSSIAFTVMVYGGRLRENRARFTGGNTREPDPAFCRTIPIGGPKGPRVTYIPFPIPSPGVSSASAGTIARINAPLPGGSPGNAKIFWGVGGLFPSNFCLIDVPLAFPKKKRSKIHFRRFHLTPPFKPPLSFSSLVES